MTSIEWLLEQVEHNISKTIIEQAKEMHKQEILDAYNNADIRSADFYYQKTLDGYESDFADGEEYYQETFVSNGTSPRGNPRSDDHISEIGKMVDGAK
jgi:hypothetical protein